MNLLLLKYNSFAYFFFFFLFFFKIKLAKSRTGVAAECFVFKRWRQSKMKINSIPVSVYDEARVSLSVKILWGQRVRETEKVEGINTTTIPAYVATCLHIFLLGTCFSFFFAQLSSERKQQTFFFLFAMYKHVDYMCTTTIVLCVSDGGLSQHKNQNKHSTEMYRVW